MRWMSSGRISPSSETFYWLRPVSSIFPRGNGGRCGFSYSKSIASLMVLLISKYDCWLFVMRVPAGPPLTLASSRFFEINSFFETSTTFIVVINN